MRRFPTDWDSSAQITYADPWVLEGLLRGDPLGRVDGQHLVNEVLGLGGNGIPLRRWKLYGATTENRVR